MEINRGKAVAFTGHRPEQLFYLNDELKYDENRLDDILLNEISRCVREGNRHHRPRHAEKNGDPGPVREKELSGAKRMS